MIQINDETYRAVLTHRVTEAERKILVLEEAIQRANHILASSREWLVHLPEDIKVEYVEAPEPIDPSLLEAKSKREVGLVNDRWAEWKKLYLSGWTVQRIAKRFRCNHTAVCHAKKMNWTPRWLEKKNR